MSSDQVLSHSHPNKKQCQYPSRQYKANNNKKKKIHITIRSSIQYRQCKVTNKFNHKTAFVINDTDPKLSRQRQSVNSKSKTLSIKPFQTIPIEIIDNIYTTNSTWANTMDYKCKLNSIQKEKKRKKLRKKCIIFSLIGILITAIIITAVCLTMLLKSKEIIKRNLTPVLRWNTTGTTIVGQTGINGTNNTLLRRPWGITVDYDSTLYVCDRDNNRIQKFLKNTIIGITIAGQANGNRNLTSDNLYGPTAIVFDSNHNFYVADSYNNRIQFFKNGQKNGSTVAGTGIVGNATNQLFYPYGIAIDEQNQLLYIADNDNNRIMIYTIGNSSGSIGIGYYGPGPNNTQFISPIAIHLDVLTNSLLIANRHRNQIVRWKIDESTWSLVAGNSSGISGSEPSYFSVPMGLILDPMGNLYVADRYNHRIQFFFPGQINGTVIAGKTLTQGNDSILLNEPYTVTLDNQLNLYVSDTSNHRIQKFERY